jgi:hypothetical protein
VIFAKKIIEFMHTTTPAATGLAYGFPELDGVNIDSLADMADRAD